MSESGSVHWYCPNRDCNWSFVGTDASEAEPLCVCGRRMKRGAVIPAFQYLDFLRDGVGEDALRKTEKE